MTGGVGALGGVVPLAETVFFMGMITFGLISVSISIGVEVTGAVVRIT